MKRIPTMKLSAALLATLAISHSQGATAAEPPQYAATVLDQLDLDGLWTEPQAINNAGAVAGRVGSPESLGFYWAPDTGAHLLQPQFDDIAAFIWANAINASGDIAGTYRPYGGFPIGIAFYLTADGTLTSLPNPDENSLIWGARDMNDQGMVVGSVGFADSPANAVYWMDGEAFIIGSLGGNASASAVNNNGLVVGTSKTATSNIDVPFRWTQATGMEALPPLEEEWVAEPYDVNDHGIAVGRAALNMFVNEAVYWDADGDIHQLPKYDDSSESAWATAINNSGVIVGYGVDSNSMFQPLIWIDDQVFDLHDWVVDLGQELHLTEPMGINDSGQIAVTAAAPGQNDISVQYLTVILTPIDEPSVPGDLNGDGVVDSEDLFLLLANWGACADPNDCPADLTGSGHVDIEDLSILLDNWG